MKNIIKRDLSFLFYSCRKLSLIYLILLLLTQIFIFLDKNLSAFNSFINLVVDDGWIYSLTSFTPPLFWMLFQLIPTLIISYGVYKDFMENSSYLIVKSPSRNIYFLSKILSGLFAIFLINLSLFLLLLIDSLIFNNFDGENFPIILRLIFSYSLSQFILFFIFFLIAIKFAYKYGISSIFLQIILSMTTNIKFIIGQASLVSKQDVFGGSISMMDNLIVWAVYIVILVLFSIKIFKNYDFLGGKDD